MKFLNLEYTHCPATLHLNVSKRYLFLLSVLLTCSHIVAKAFFIRLASKIHMLSNKCKLPSRKKYVSFPTNYFLLHMSLIMDLARKQEKEKLPRTVKDLNISNNIVTLSFS